MENSNLEIERFSKKAKSYRTALDSAPYARSLEVVPILSILEAYLKNNEYEKSDLRIIDLMSGSGYLTNILKKGGFKKIHAIEACNEMSHDSEFYDRVQLHSIPSINDTHSILKKIKPNVIISLASFHHLIIREKDGSINFEQSIRLQEELTSVCLRNLHRNGIIIIVDLFQDSFLSAVRTSDNCKLWSKNSVSRIIKNLFINEQIKNRIKNSKSLDEYSNSLLITIPSLSNKVNPSLDWFRKVVDKRTSIGHDDYP